MANIPADRIEGCILVPLDQAKSDYPKVASNVLEETYYRVTEATGKVRAMVTVMPDGGLVAWDTCSLCHGYFLHCRCSTGIYHPRSVAWIRATHDIKYPSERVTDYSRYYNPQSRSTAGLSVLDSSKPAPVKRKKKEVNLDEIDMEQLDKEAKKLARSNTRRTRSAIRGGRRV